MRSNTLNALQQAGLYQAKAEADNSQAYGKALGDVGASIVRSEKQSNYGYDDYGYDDDGYDGYDDYDPAYPTTTLSTIY